MNEAAHHAFLRSEILQPVDFPALSPLCIVRESTFVVIEEGLQIVPPTPVDHEQRIDVGI